MKGYPRTPSHLYGSSTVLANASRVPLPCYASTLPGAVKRLRKIGDQYWLVSDNPEGESLPLDRVARNVGQVYRRVSYQEVR